MVTSESASGPEAQAALQLVDLAQDAIAARNVDELVARVLTGVESMTGSAAVLLYLADPRLGDRSFTQRGWGADRASEMERLCVEQYDQIRDRGAWQRRSVPGVAVMLHALPAAGRCVGLIGMAADDETARIQPDVLARLPGLVANAIARLGEHVESEKKLAHLNTYLTVSSMLAQSLDLGELLDTALYCCMDAVSAEAASVLLLDDERQNFRFYQVGGPAKPALEGATFPADQGLAGSVLKTGQAEIINAVHDDPRFLDTVDAKSGFRTRNIIAVPLVAGEEQIGVLEILNKTADGAFVQDDLLLLVSIAEEIAFAIRNAKVFEYVVNTYCLQRQGIMSCRGCKRPLGSWTPCVKYREAGTRT